MSRGYPQEEGVEVGFETNNFTSPLTNKIVKSCPIPAVQTYEFDPSAKGLNLGLVSKEEEKEGLLITLQKKVALILIRMVTNVDYVTFQMDVFLPLGSQRRRR